MAAQNDALAQETLVKEESEDPGLGLGTTRHRGAVVVAPTGPTKVTDPIRQTSDVLAATASDRKRRFEPDLRRVMGSTIS